MDGVKRVDSLFVVINRSMMATDQSRDVLARSFTIIFIEDEPRRERERERERERAKAVHSMIFNFPAGRVTRYRRRVYRESRRKTLSQRARIFKKKCRRAAQRIAVQ